MELVVRKNDLLRELQLFQGIVERKNTIPILANVLLDAKDGEVRFLATDLEVAPAQPVRRHRHQTRLADAAGKEALRNREVAARHRHSNCRGQEWREGCGRSIRLADADAPEGRLSDPSGRRRQPDRVAVRVQRSKEMVAKTQFAITGEDTRYFLNGAQFVLRGDSMSLVATDGHRLALVTVQARRRPGRT